MLHLGFTVRVLGQPGLRSHDGRRWQQSPHLSVSLVYLRDILGYLRQQQICFYRLAAELAPYLNHRDLPGFQRQLEECRVELAEVGSLARGAALRLTMHLGSHVTLGTPDEALAARSVAEIVAQGALLDGLELGPEAVLVVHVGGEYADKATTLDRFARRYSLLPPDTRRRVVVEHDDRSWSLGALLPLHQICGVPLVFDYLHYQLHNPEGLGLGTALSLALATWPAGVRPKVHFSSPRTEGHLGPRGGGAAVLPPRPGQHADFINPFEFSALVRAARSLEPFDIMLEAKAGDLALLRLREDLGRYAPDMAGVVH